MNKSASLLFPFRTDNESQSLKRAETVESVLLSAIRLFLITRKGSRLGNEVGCFLPELLHELIPYSALSGLAEELKQELTEQFAGVEFLSVKLTKENTDNVSSLVVNIKLTISSQDNIIELTTKLPTVFDSQIIERENI